MGELEIILLVLGLVIFVLSFAIPEKKDKISKEDKKLGEELVGRMVDEQMSVVSSQIDYVLDEKKEAQMERLERRMERLSNEKILAVGEYSDTVLDDIKKSHDEVVFLYDMLNSKHKTLTELIKTADNKKMEQNKNQEKKQKEKKQQEESVLDEFSPLQPMVLEPVIRKEEKKSKVAIQFSKNNTMGKNSNERILKLHKEGKSNMIIAKELGLGIGEVKLVIDLFKGM